MKNTKPREENNKRPTDKEVLERLLVNQYELWHKFSVLSHETSIPDIYEKNSLLSRIMKMQELIDNLKIKIALKNNSAYMTKFGQIVCSEKEMKYWNDVYDYAYSEDKKEISNWHLVYQKEFN